MPLRKSLGTPGEPIRGEVATESSGTAQFILVDGSRRILISPSSTTIVSPSGTQQVDLIRWGGTQQTGFDFITRFTGTVMTQIGGTVSAIQGTSPWTTRTDSSSTVNVSGTVITGNTSTINTIPTGTQQSDIRLWGGTVQTGIDFATRLTSTLMSITGGTVSAIQGTSPWIVRSDSSSTVNISGTIITGNTSTTNILGTPTINISQWGGTIQSGFDFITRMTSTLMNLTGGTISVLQGTSPWSVKFSDNTSTVSVTGNVIVTTTSTISVLQGTTPWNVGSSAVSSTVVTNNTSTVNVAGTVDTGDRAGRVLGVLASNTSTVNVLQGTSPWTTRTDTSSTTNIAGTPNFNLSQIGTTSQTGFNLITRLTSTLMTVTSGSVNISGTIITGNTSTVNIAGTVITGDTSTTSLFGSASTVNIASSVVLPVDLFFTTGAVASITSTQFNVTTTAATLVAINVFRVGVLIKNRGAGDLLIKHGVPPTATDFDYYLKTDQERQYDYIFRWIGDIQGITASGSSTVTVLDF